MVKRKKEQEMQKFQSDVQRGKIPSIIADSGATSLSGNETDPFIITDKLLTKVFHTPLGQVAKAMHTAKLIYQVQEPAQMVHIVPGLQKSSPLSTSKLADANYITIFTKS